MMFKLIATAMLASVIAAPAAFAAPPKHMDDHNRQHMHRPPSHGHHNRPDRRYRPNHHYRPGHHYHAAPHGWHRYHYRPRDWRTRGCIVVGPLWFCP
jgi:Ni/Co efflux regulator RcnB